MKKTYVLDTNILIQSPESIFGFADNDVVVTGTTLQELDKLKVKKGDVGHNAVKVNHLIENLGQYGNYIQGISLKNGGRFLIEPNNVNPDNLPVGYSLDNPDNRIISTCVSLSMNNQKVILVTNDVSMRTNASICGIKTEGYRNEQAGYDKVYKGKREVSVPNELIDVLYAEKKIDSSLLSVEEPFIENEFIVLKGINKSAIAIYYEAAIHLLSDKTLLAFGVKPKNIVAQKFVMHAMLDPRVNCVILQGPAGCAKTFLSLACGLEQSDSRGFENPDAIYKKIMITRANVLSDNDLGYLPGTLEEKMTPLIAPFVDNLENLLRLKGLDNKEISETIEDLFATNTIEIEAIAYMRGRSISDTYLIVDEAQNTTPGQIKELITRAGEGTKIIICGDPEQIDSPNLDRYNNGLVYAAEKMKGYARCAQYVFDGKNDGVRSELAVEAAKRMV